jgi:hypothetical protein
VSGLSEKFDLAYQDLFRAPDRDGAVVSVRVHRKVKSALEELARREGLSGVSELVRYLIAGYLLGKYGIERPRERAIVEPIVLTVNVQRGPQRAADSVDVDIAREEIEAAVRDIEDYIKKVRAGLVPRNVEVVSRLSKRLARAMGLARRLGLEDEYVELAKLKARLAMME